LNVPTRTAGARTDIGRVVAVTVFVLLLLMNLRKLATGAWAESPLSILVSVLTGAFYVLLIVAYLRRTPSDRTDRRWSSWAVALAGTAAPFFIPVLSTGPATGTVRELVSAAILGIGLVAMLWALGALGTNISVVPQARTMVTHGPYQLVRHPLYAAELVNVLGLCVSRTGVWPWLVFVALITFQVARARREEALLSRELPGYVEYRASTPMLVPALRRR
jgi:protein-S-isoprenylcysteine O-methyltransferase Ste14